MKDFLSDMFGTIFDTIFGIYDPSFHNPVFQHLYESGFYILLGLVFLIIPIILLSLFYFLWKYPYGNIWHWLIWSFIILIVVFLVSFGISDSFILNSNNPEMHNCYNLSECYNYIGSLPLKYSLANTSISLIIILIISLIIKRYSKIQTHLPF